MSGAIKDAIKLYLEIFQSRMEQALDQLLEN